MFAVTIVDGALEWQEHPDPEPGPGELLVSVAAAGINAADLMQRRGLYPAPPGAPADIPGPRVRRRGGRRSAPAPTGSRVGDRVMAITGGGGQGQLVVVPESTALPVPDGVAWDQAGGFPEAFSTAYDALFTQAGLAAGDRVLDLGGGRRGGHGRGAAGPRRRGPRGGLGPVDPSAATRSGPSGPTRSSTPTRWPTTVPTTSPSSWSARPGWPPSSRRWPIGGRVVVIGVGAGAKVELNLLALMASRSTIGGLDAPGRARWRRRRRWPGPSRSTPCPCWPTGKVTVPVAERFPMAEAAEAYERFAAGGKLGKIVLVNE